MHYNIVLLTKQAGPMYAQKSAIVFLDQYEWKEYDCYCFDEWDRFDLPAVSLLSEHIQYVKSLKDDMIELEEDLYTKSRERLRLYENHRLLWEDIKQLADLKMQNFSKFCNIYNIDTLDYSIPDDTDWRYVISVDLHY